MIWGLKYALMIILKERKENNFLSEKDNNVVCVCALFFIYLLCTTNSSPISILICVEDWIQPQLSSYHFLHSPLLFISFLLLFLSSFDSSTVSTPKPNEIELRILGFLMWFGWVSQTLFHKSTFLTESIPKEREHPPFFFPLYFMRITGSSVLQ